MISGVYISLFLTLLYTTSAELTNANIRIDSASSRFIDEFGRQRIFHGLNAVYKSAPYLPVAPASWVIDKQVLTKFKYYGVNILRVGLMYAGVMPSKGQINSTYLDLMESLVSLCQEHDVYTLLDSHQDLFSEAVGGDGFPGWSLIQGNAREFPYPLPSTNLSWELYYMTEIVNSGFGHFYNNTDDLQSYYSQFWSESAKRFVKYSHVLGYELLNEPWCGDVYQSVSIAFPDNAYSKNLQPLYDTISREIWSQDPDHMVFFESVTWDLVQSGMSHVPGYADNANKTVLSYHYYIPPQFGINSTLKTKFHTREEFKCGTMLTEFEIWNGETEEFKNILRSADVWKESWIGWLANPLVLFSNTDTFLSTFAHPYAQIVAGNISEMNFEPETNVFSLNYTTSVRITSNETVIFVNKELHFPNDFKVVSVPTEGVTITRVDADNLVMVYHEDNISKYGRSIQIVISPKEEFFVHI